MNAWKISTVALALALGLVVGGGTIRTAQAEQANMEGALTKLQDAKGALERAADDKAGHRVKAISLVTQAIEETRQGIQAGKGK
ncbi:MAG: hypothetical protein ACLQBL_18005 [Polyangiaceae bacterium]